MLLTVAALLIFQFLCVCSTIILADLATLWGDVVFYYQTINSVADQPLDSGSGMSKKSGSVTGIRIRDEQPG
jgi:hypothetical protein